MAIITWGTDKSLESEYPPTRCCGTCGRLHECVCADWESRLQ
jgi:hypothetical protein